MIKLASFLFLLLIVGGKSAQENAVLNCLVDQDSLGCVKNLTDATLDAIELKVTGTKDNVTFSKVMERTSGFIVHEISNLFDDNTREGRKIKIGKKKKKLLHKLLPLFHLLQAKISLILQLISTHFQFKFFAIAVVGLIINFVRLWIDLKKGHHPSKVIYYEHAQHQHHYEPEEDHGSYWRKKRSLDQNQRDPNQLAYRAWTR
ncbi:uncharacterized protein LOC123268417 [Cotesia glomerata]|uniref:Uncharacterized protein n=1 Tax=Cotesia glomerata TaxID=32391 RepID=A0AAV7IB57_COTGL|nr:uncharacterized protein LOC123268417 [Cotesia glomerata]KAH0547457.1 hypothetical protein KQX54_019394 [Cotesia glomerata]